MCTACEFITNCLCSEAKDLKDQYAEDTVEDMLCVRKHFYRSLFGGCIGTVAGAAADGTAVVIGSSFAAGCVGLPVGLCLLGKCFEEMKDCCEICCQKKETTDSNGVRNLESPQNSTMGCCSAWDWLCFGSKKENATIGTDRTQPLLNTMS